MAKVKKMMFGGVANPIAKSNPVTKGPMPEVSSPIAKVAPRNIMPEVSSPIGRPPVRDPGVGSMPRGPVSNMPAPVGGTGGVRNMPAPVRPTGPRMAAMGFKAKGGKVTSSASKRADGIAMKGKTKGKIC